MTSRNGEGAASAAPSTPAEAERLIVGASTPQEAYDLYVYCLDKESGWQAVKLKAQRRYGELLGPAKIGGLREGHVSGVHVVPNAERCARRDARKVAAVPQDDFDEYLRTEPLPTRIGLLRKYGMKPPPSASSKSKRVSSNGPTPAGKRMHGAKMGRNTAKRAGREVAFWELAWEVSRLVYGLAGWHVETIPLDEDNRDAMITVEEDLLYLYDWMDDTLAFIHSRMGEDGMRRQLGKLRAKTVANGCTPEEADAAERAAKRLERKINNALMVAS